MSTTQHIDVGSLGPVPGLAAVHPLNLLLQLEEAVHQSLSCGWAAGDINVNLKITIIQSVYNVHAVHAHNVFQYLVSSHRHNSVAPPDHCVAVMIVSTPVGAAAHADHPPGLGHLVIHLPEGGGHFVGQRPSHDDHIGLAGGGSEP